MIQSGAAKQRVDWLALRDFGARVFSKLGVAYSDAQLTAEVLVAADLRGVASHGVAHLARYVRGIRDGVILPCPQERIVTETLVSASIDAGAGLGPPAAYRAMQRAVAKAEASGAGFVAVRNSNHFGIAGYYSMMALDHDCIGMCLTNGSPMLVPTFARNATLGTDPISVAIPAGHGPAFVLDMATTAVSLGKLEIAEQLGLSIPPGWANDAQGNALTDPSRAIADFRGRAGGGLLPLGGAGEQGSGYKGYGLALWVEIFSSLLSGAAFSTLTYPRTSEGRPLPANVGHFFGAWRIDAFRPVEEFYATMDELLRMLRAAPKANGQARVYIPGEKEQEASEVNRRDGVPVNRAVITELETIAKELDLSPTW